MAVFNQNYREGTKIVWGPANGTGVTKNFSINGLASTSAWMGEVADLGIDIPPLVSVNLYVETGLAPAAGLTIDLYLAWSQDGIRFPSIVTGLDASFTRGINDANLRPFGGIIYSLVVLNLANTRLYQRPWYVQPFRYVVPVLVNNMGQAIRNQSPASNNLTRVEIVPMIPRFSS
jgi:hypothetical protein